MALRASDCNGWPCRWVSGRRRDWDPGKLKLKIRSRRGDQREAVFRDGEDRQKLLATLGEACRKTERPAAAPFLPRRAICNLENLEGETKPPLSPKDAWWGRWARIWCCLASAVVGQGGYFSDFSGDSPRVPTGWLPESLRVASGRDMKLQSSLLNMDSS